MSFNYTGTGKYKTTAGITADVIAEHDGMLFGGYAGYHCVWGKETGYCVYTNSSRPRYIKLDGKKVEEPTK